MNVQLTIYRSRDVHKLTVVARPSAAAALGEHVLIEGMVIGDVGRADSAVELLRAAYMAVAEEMARRSELL